LRCFLTIEEAFGIVVRRFRKDRHLSQDELSKFSSLDRVFISQLERGRQQPTLVTIFQLAAALNVPVASILAETDLLLGFNRIKFQNHNLNSVPYEKLWEQFGGAIIPEHPVITQKKTILIADDEPDMCHFLQDLLKKYGYSVIIAQDGQDALDKFIENIGVVDLVLMDIMMPRKDGVTVHNEIARLNPNVKVLLMSGHSIDSLCVPQRLKFIDKKQLPVMLLNNIRELLD